MKKVPEAPALPRPGQIKDVASAASAIGQIVRGAAAALTDYAFRINRTLPKDGTEAMTGPLPLRSYTVATRPDATLNEGAVIYVSDAAAGAIFQGSNGAAWVNLG